jgi:triacylglycerol lipase
MKLFTALSLTVLLICGSAKADSTGFEGGRLRLEIFFPMLNNPIISPYDLTVTPGGARFENLRAHASPGYNLVPLSIAVTNNTLQFDFSQTAGYSLFAPAPFDGPVFTTSGGIPPITGVTIDPSTTLGLDSSRISFTANQIFVNTAGLSFNTQTIAKLNVTFQVTSPPTPIPVLSVTPPNSLDFGQVEVNNSRDLTFIVSNSGSDTLMGNVSTSAPFSIVSGASFSLISGESQQVLVRFSPITTGPFTANITFTSNVGSASPSLQGIGIPDAPGTLQFSASAYAVIENEGSIIISVNRTGGSKGPASVRYTTSKGTAIPKNDYIANSGTLSWVDGDTTTKTFPITIIDDVVAEKNESFKVTLKTTIGATLGTPSRATVAIVNEDKVLGNRPFPVIFIHGLASSTEAWASFRNYLSKFGGWVFGGIPSYNQSTKNIDISCPFNPNQLITCTGSSGDFYTLNFSDNQWLSLESQGGELAAIIKAVLNANPGKERVILVAHSMGGLAAREYLQGLAETSESSQKILYRGDVNKLVTIGTPHQGSYLADICQSNYDSCSLLDFANPFSTAVSALIPDSTSLNTLNDLRSNPLPSSVSYFSLIGTGQRTFIRASLSDLVRPSAYTEGDGVVSYVSQNLRRVTNSFPLQQKSSRIDILFQECGHKWTAPVFKNAILGETHTCETNDPGVWAQILRALR